MAIVDLKNALFILRDRGANFIEINVGEGSLTYSEVRELNVVKDRGELDKIREGEEQTMPVEFTFIWEFITADAGDPPTIEDVLKNRAGWLSASLDPDDPFCVNIQVVYTPECAEVAREIITLREFHYSDLAHAIKDGTVAVKGLCNDTEALIQRIA